jgi:hypothetical protein
MVLFTDPNALVLAFILIRHAWTPRVVITKLRAITPAALQAELAARIAGVDMRSEVAVACDHEREHAPHGELHVIAS